MTTENLEPIEDLQARGLTREEASARLAQYGPNTVREAKSHLFLAIAKKFWAPVPWMLEATIALEIILGKRPEAVIIGVLLVFNAGLGLLQENRAQNALALLRKRLPVKARVRRGGQWQSLAAQLQTLVFVTLVFTGQGTVYLVRQRQHFWKSRPSKWLLLSSAAD
ncbi:MAG: cation-transporting P-type ATPase, partial [Terriglobales bacterium]